MLSYSNITGVTTNNRSVRDRGLIGQASEQKVLEFLCEVPYMYKPTQREVGWVRYCMPRLHLKTHIQNSTSLFSCEKSSHGNQSARMPPASLPTSQVKHLMFEIRSVCLACAQRRHLLLMFGSTAGRQETPVLCQYYWMAQVPAEPFFAEALNLVYQTIQMEASLHPSMPRVSGCHSP
jgi:hypothetical protein